VKTAVDPRLCAEAAEYQLRFTCEDCAHFSEPEQRCANGYPNLVHLRARCEPGAVFEFCKEFELR
jgi:hypothetical protein